LDHVWNAISDFFSGLGTKIAGVATGMWDGIGNAFIGVINKIISIWDDLKFKTPSFDRFGVHTPSITIGVPHIDQIKGFAAGTGSDQFSGGLALAGENGPELLNFGSPVQIFDANTTAGLLGSGLGGRTGRAVTIGTVELHDEPTSTASRAA
jgi:hypothetical protein